MPPTLDLPHPRHAPIEPAPIDVSPLRTALAELHSPRRSRRDAAIDDVRASPRSYPPPVLYALAHALFARGEPDEALFWYHAGQLRAWFDVERCADPTVADVVERLRRQYGGPINGYAFVDAELDVLRTAVRRAVEWDRATAHDYDHRWVNLHGVRAFAGPGPGVALSRPRAQWPGIAERVRADYLAGMHSVLQDLESWAPLGASA
jgi:hypothetical protein